MERGHMQGLPNLLGTPYQISKGRVKIRTSNFVGTFMGSIRTKAHEKCWE